MSEIKAGDVVQLKSGGVPMTVSSVKGDTAVCEWQVNALPKDAVYKTVILEIYKPFTGF